MNQIFVGNIGSVWYGASIGVASKTFTYYKKQSKLKTGRASGESVIWMQDGEIKKEFIGKNDLTIE